MKFPTTISRTSSFPVLGKSGGIFHFYSNFDRIFCKQIVENPDQTPRYAVSDPGLHCLPMSHKKDAMLIWVNSAIVIPCLRYKQSKDI